MTYFWSGPTHIPPRSNMVPCIYLEYVLPPTLSIAYSIVILRDGLFLRRCYAADNPERPAPIMII